MSAFAKIIKGLAKPSSSDVESRSRSPHVELNVQPLSIEITNQIPHEIFEYFIYFLTDDLIALRSCTLVCRTWKQMCQPLLFRMLLRPRPVTNPRFKFKDKVQCAVIHELTKTILYGTDQGMFWGNLDHPDDAPVRVMAFLDIKQIDIMTLNGRVFVILLASNADFRLGDMDLRDVISGDCLYKSPLDALDPSRSSTGNPSVQAWPSDMEFYTIGKLSDVEVITVVRKKKHKVLRCSPAGDFVVHSHYTVNHPTSSLCYLKRRVVAIHPSVGFDVISLQNMTSVIIPDSNEPEFKFTKSAKALALQPVGDHFILCFDKFAFYVDQSTKRLNDTLIEWRYTAQHIVFHGRYLLVFSADFLEIRQLRTGSLCQLIQRKFRLLSGSTSSRVIIIRDDGRIYAMKQ